MAVPARDESLQDETYLPQEGSAEIIDFLDALQARGREAADRRPRLTGSEGRSVELPEQMFEVLLQGAAAMKAGLAVTVAPHHLTLSTQEAADLLRISRTTLVRLLETGAIPLHVPVAHVEAGLRSFDNTMPEEINRRLIDQLCELLFVTSPEAIGYLGREGIAAD